MSHVANVALEVKDLDCLGKAATRLGMWMKQQPTYKWWGHSVGDYPLPAGFTKDDLGKCEYAIGVPGNDKAYEVGVVKRRDGKPGYLLQWDFYAGGYGLQEKVGVDCNLLKQAYGTEVAAKELRKKGFRVQEQQRQDGSIRLLATK